MNTKITITKENPPYGHAKWHLVKVFSNGSKSSDWFKTEKEAIWAKELYISRNGKYYSI